MGDGRFLDEDVTLAALSETIQAGGTAVTARVFHPERRHAHDLPPTIGSRNNPPNLGKLFSETIEEINTGPVEAVTATGANRMQTLVYAVVPQLVLRNRLGRRVIISGVPGSISPDLVAAAGEEDPIEIVQSADVDIVVIQAIDAYIKQLHAGFVPTQSHRHDDLCRPAARWLVW